MRKPKNRISVVLPGRQIFRIREPIPLPFVISQMAEVYNPGIPSYDIRRFPSKAPVLFFSPIKNFSASISL